MNRSPDDRAGTETIRGRQRCESMGYEGDLMSQAHNASSSKTTDEAVTDSGGGRRLKLRYSPRKAAKDIGEKNCTASLSAKGVPRPDRRQRTREESTRAATPTRRSPPGTMPQRPAQKRATPPSALRDSPRRRTENLGLDAYGECDDDDDDDDDDDEDNEEEGNTEAGNDEGDEDQAHSDDEAQQLARSCPGLPARRNRARSLSDAQVEHLKSTTAQMLFNSDLAVVSKASSSASSSSSAASSASSSSNEASPVPKRYKSNTVLQDPTEWRRQMNQHLEGQSLLRKY